MVCYDSTMNVTENIYGLDCCFACKLMKDCRSIQKKVLADDEMTYCRNCSGFFDCENCLNYIECFKE